MNVGTVLFQMFLVGAVMVLAVVITMEAATRRTIRQYHEGRWLLNLMERGYLRRMDRKFLKRSR